MYKWLTPSDVGFRMTDIAAESLPDGDGGDDSRSVAGISISSTFPESSNMSPVVRLSLGEDSISLTKKIRGCYLHAH